MNKSSPISHRKTTLLAKFALVHSFYMNAEILKYDLRGH